MEEKSISHLFQPGQSGNPAGRPKGITTGRTQAVALLDDVLKEPDVRRVMREKLRAYILDDPVRAFRKLVIPLLPREARMEVGDSVRVVVWKSILECNRDSLANAQPSLDSGDDPGVSSPATRTKCP